MSDNPFLNYKYDTAATESRSLFGSSGRQAPRKQRKIWERFEDMTLEDLTSSYHWGSSSSGQMNYEKSKYDFLYVCSKKNKR